MEFRRCMIQNTLGATTQTRSTVVIDQFVTKMMKTAMKEQHQNPIQLAPQISFVQNIKDTSQTQRIASNIITASMIWSKSTSRVLVIMVNLAFGYV